MSAAPCQKASQPQESQRGCRRFRNLADGKGADGHGTAVAGRTGPASQGQPVQVKNRLVIIDFRFVDQGRVSKECLHIGRTVFRQEIDGELAGIGVGNGAAFPGNIHIVSIIGKGPCISGGGKTEGRRLRIVRSCAQGKDGAISKLEVGNVHHKGIGGPGQGDI